MGVGGPKDARCRLQDTGYRTQGAVCELRIFCAKMPFFSRLLAMAKSRWLPVIASDLWRAVQSKGFRENELDRKQRFAD